jgi:hypothetical protein
MYRRKGVQNGNVPLSETDVMSVLKYMTTNIDIDSRSEQSWNPENFGNVTAQLVGSILLEG